MTAQFFKSISLKMLYRYKVCVFTGIVAAVTFFLVYVTGPKPIQGPQIRVLYISFDEHHAVERLTPKSAFVPDGFVQVLPIAEDNSVVVSREEWDLKSTLEDFYQNNIVLECSSTFPVTWGYTGFGDPSVTEKNLRIHGNYNDTSTFSYKSFLNLMPITEKSTGQYSCYGVTNDTVDQSTSVHLYVPGNATFLIDYDTTIEAPGNDEVFVPCPVTNGSAEISLYFKNEPVTTEDDESLFSFDPKTGFNLKHKFIEQFDPWGDYYCRNEKTKEKSGMITIQPGKGGLIVNAVPEGELVLLSTSKHDVKENCSFTCQAKEEITLKFLRVVKNPMVQYDYNSSSPFPFSAYTEVSTKNFKNLSRIYCRTVRSNQDLHSWRVIFSSLPAALKTELMEFQYDSNREDFSCCSPSNKRAKLAFLSCNTISECKINGNCLMEGHKCSSEGIIWSPERAGCVRHTISKRSKSGNDIWHQSGLVQCSIDGKSVTRVFSSSMLETVNGSQLNTIVSDELTFSEFSTPPNLMDMSNPQSKLEIIELPSSAGRISRRRFVCRGPKFFLAIGFIWQIIQTNNQMKFQPGRDSVKGAWIHSQFDLNVTSRGSSIVKRIYCIAPVWNSNAEWINKRFDL